MAAQTKIRLDLRNLSNFLPGYDEDNFESTMSQEEIEHWSDLSDALWEQGKEEEADDAAGKIPLEPGFALMQYVMLGREGLLSTDFNLADAEKAYGPNWLDKFEVGNGYIHLKKVSDE